MAKVQVYVVAEALVEIEEEYFDGYSTNDLLEAADNSATGWELVNVRFPNAPE